MKVKEMITTSLLLAMGLTLHTIVPSVFGMKFDLLLTFMFIAIGINPTVKNAALTGAVAGALTALTTTFPGGQIPNLVDKCITAMVVLTLIVLFKNTRLEKISMGIIGFVGTLISGIIFLGTALILFGLPAPMNALLLTVVLPTAFSNAIMTLVLEKSVMLALQKKRLPKRS